MKVVWIVKFHYYDNRGERVFSNEKSAQYFYDGMQTVLEASSLGHFKIEMTEISVNE
jgi:hypothetical protein